jgi:hypothetical protein
MLVWEGRGRSKYFSLAGADVAQAVEALSEIGIHQVPAAARELRFARCCYDHLAGWLGDWTERRAHVAGALGAALLDHYKRERWLLPVEDSRRLVVTPAGKSAFARFFDIDTTSI